MNGGGGGAAFDVSNGMLSFRIPFFARCKQSFDVAPLRASMRVQRNDFSIISLCISLEEANIGRTYEAFAIR